MLPLPYPRLPKSETADELEAQFQVFCKDKTSRSPARRASSQEFYNAITTMGEAVRHRHFRGLFAWWSTACSSTGRSASVCASVHKVLPLACSLAIFLNPNNVALIYQNVPCLESSMPQSNLSPTYVNAYCIYLEAPHHTLPRTT